MSTKKLYRIKEGKMLAGVCGGIAVYFDLDPSLVRLLWVLFTCFVGAGILAYIIAAFIIPDQDSISPDQESAPSNRDSNTSEQ